MNKNESIAEQRRELEKLRRASADYQARLYTEAANAQADLWALRRKVDAFREQLYTWTNASHTDLVEERVTVGEVSREFVKAFGAVHTTGPIPEPAQREECDGCAFLGVTERGVRWCKNGGRPGRRIAIGVIPPGGCPAAGLPRRNDATAEAG